MNQVEFGSKLSKARKEKKLTQEKLAEILGVSNKSISRWENGINMPDISLLPKISEILEISIFEMLGGDKEMKKENVDKVLVKTINKFSKQDKIIKICKIIMVLLTINLIFILGFFIRNLYLDNKYLFNVSPEKVKYNELKIGTMVKIPLSYDDLYTNSIGNDKSIGLDEGIFSKLPLYQYKDFSQIIPNESDIQYTLGMFKENKKYGYSEDDINKTYKDEYYTKKSMYVISIALFSKIYNLETVTFHFNNQYYQISKDSLKIKYEFELAYGNEEKLKIDDYNEDVNKKLSDKQFLDSFFSDKKIDFDN